MAKKKEMKIWGTLGSRWLWTLHEIAGKNKKNTHERLAQSSLKRCSAISNDKKDTAFNQAENTRIDKLNSTPVSVARHMGSSLQRCSAVSNDKKDTAFNQTENTRNDKLNPTPVSALHRKMGDDKDSRFSQLKKTMRAKSCAGPFYAEELGCVTPYSRALARHVGKHGVLRLALSPKAAKLVKGGMGVGMVVQSVGLQNAFTSWRNNMSIYASLRVKNDSLTITKA